MTWFLAVGRRSPSSWSRHQVSNRTSLILLIGSLKFTFYFRYAYECRWSVDGVRCSTSFSQFGDLISHLGRSHGVRGPPRRLLVCQWMTHTGVCENTYRRSSFRKHIGTHLGIHRRRGNDPNKESSVVERHREPGNVVPARFKIGSDGLLRQKACVA